MTPSATTPKIHRQKLSPGMTLVMTVVFLGVIIVLVAAVYSRTNSNVQSTSRRINNQASILIAEAGIEKAVWCLNNPINTIDCPNNPNYIGENSVPFGQGFFTTTVSGSGNNRTITATGTKTGTGGTSSKEIQVLLSTAAGTSASFQYGVQTGEGGIILDNNAKINGNAYTNGSITGGNGSTITGDAVLAVSSPTTDQSADPGISPLLTKNFGDASSTLYLAQSFIAGINDSIYSIDFKLAKHNSPTSTLKLYIYSDNAGNPGSDITSGGQAVSVSIPNDSPAGWENGWTNQIYNPNTALLAGTKYWLVFEISSSNSSKYWTAVHGADDTTYASGTAKVGSSTSGMTALNYDLAFRINVGGQTPTLKIPTIGGNAYSHKIEDTVITKKAYYQTVDGTVKANLTDSCTEGENGPNCFDNSVDQPPQNFPISNAQITQMEGQAAAGGTTTCSPTCTLDGISIGPRKYNGNVTLLNTVTLTGTVWVNGDLTISNNSILQLDQGYGTNSGTIIAHKPTDPSNSGRITLSNNGNLTGNYAICTGSPKKCNAGTKSGQACTVNTDCPNDNYIMAVSMNADPSFVTPAIEVSNNLTAGVLYAPNGLVNVSNNANLDAVTGQKIHLNNNCEINYKSGLASVLFTSGPGGSWVYQKGSYQIVN